MYIESALMCTGSCWLYLLVESNKSPIATTVIRGAPENLMDDIERAIDDGVNAYKALTKVLLVVHISTHISSHVSCITSLG